ncbi:MAG TPA: hypothetical protein VFL56_01185 [Solirubrobacterales bacterium]|nr:hypothetical protein [Solirubrobacterales bacterium]
MKLLRMSAGKGDVVLAEGDPRIAEDEERLIEEFRRQLDLGMWAAVPHEGDAGRREATMVTDFSEIPEGAERVIFFPRAAGGQPAVSAEERRARVLLRSVVGDVEAELYEELGFLAVEEPDGEYGYLIYPQRPIVSYDARSGELLSEYCVRFREGGGDRLPDADDVLAKWMALQWDPVHLLGIAGLDRPGTQLDPAMVRRDLASLRDWRHARVLRSGEGAPPGATRSASEREMRGRATARPVS